MVGLTAVDRQITCDIPRADNSFNFAVDLGALGAGRLQLLPRTFLTYFRNNQLLRIDIQPTKAGEICRAMLLYTLVERELLFKRLL